MLNSFDIVIVGAGPAGMTAAIRMADSGLKIAVLEKDVFPRDKICGDALSGKVMNILKRMPGNTYGDFLEKTDKYPVWGIRFIAPGMTSLDVRFLTGSRAGDIAPVYTCRRLHFDSFLREICLKYRNISILENETVNSAFIRDGKGYAETSGKTFCGKLLIGADGHRSLLHRSLAGYTEDKRNLCLAVRAYYENVEGKHPEDFIELFFLKELLPGYFWIFSMPGNQFNVGLGMMHHQVIKRRLNLSQVLEEIIRSHPQIAPRFRNARRISGLQAHTLPLGKVKTTRSGDHFMLLGDAASLVDPFSGEGIGNAMASGEVAGEVALKCFETNRFDAEFLKYYEERIAKRITWEFRYSGAIQKLGRYAGIFNFVARRAARNKELHDLLETVLIDDRLRRKLKNPLFYFKLLTL